MFFEAVPTGISLGTERTEKTVQTKAIGVQVLDNTIAGFWRFRKEVGSQSLSHLDLAGSMLELVNKHSGNGAFISPPHVLSTGEHENSIFFVYTLGEGEDFDEWQYRCRSFFMERHRIHYRGLHYGQNVTEVMLEPITA